MLFYFYFYFILILFIHSFIFFWCVFFCLGFGDTLRVNKKNDYDINFLSAEQSTDPLRSVEQTQVVAFQEKNPFRKSTSKSDRPTNQVILQTSIENKSQGLHVDDSTKNLISWLGIKIQTILRRLMQPVKQYLALTKPPIQSKPSFVKERDYFRFKSNKLNRNSAENEVDSAGKILKIEIPTPDDKRIPDTNQFKSREEFIATFGFLGSPTKRLTRRSVNRYLTKEFETRRSSELEGDGSNDIFKPKKLPSMPTSGDQHIDGLFLDKNFLMGVSYFVHHPDKMSSADAPGIVGIGKLRPTRPPSTTISSTVRSVVKKVEAKAFGSDTSKYVAGSSEEETDITHEYTKTVESHRSKIKSRKKHKNYEQARNSVNMSVKSKHIHTFPYNKQAKIEDLTPRPFPFMSSTQTPQVTSYLQPVTQINYANEVTFSTGVYPQSYLSTTPRSNNELLDRHLKHDNQPFHPGSYFGKNRVSTSEKPSHLQQFISDPMGVIVDPQNGEHANYIFHEANRNPFSNLNSIDSGNLFGNDQSKRPNSWFQQQLDNLNINVFSKSKMYSNSKDLAQEQTYRLHQPFSRVSPITGAQGNFPEAYKYDRTNTYEPRVNYQSDLDSSNPHIYSYGNWRNRIPVVLAFWNKL